MVADGSLGSLDILRGKQRFVNSRTSDDTLADKYMKEWKPTGRFQCKSVLNFFLYVDTTDPPVWW